MTTIDYTALYNALNDQRNTNGLHWTDVATHTGVAAVVFSRLKNGRRCSTENYASCCRWLGVRMETFVTND